ncbi:hypothetical protein N9L47_04795 [Rhodobacteraceae bacterium]|nr:hypothetical protein [Paracoccaceae bacterium]
MRNLYRLLMPTLFPSWRFFEQVGPSPRIEYRTNLDASWQSTSQLPDRLGPKDLLRRLFFSPAWNEHLFLISTATRLAVDPMLHDVTEIRARLARRLGQTGAETYQFRILFLSREGGKIGQFVIYESTVQLTG